MAMRRKRRGEPLDPVRGLWICKTSDTRQGMETTAYRWVKTGKMPAPPKGCGNWNVYIARDGAVVGGPVKVIDAHCKRCGRRIKMQISRQDNRGQVSPANFLMRPHHMPRKALIEEMMARNRRDALNAEIDGFQKASDLHRGGS